MKIIFYELKKKIINALVFGCLISERIFQVTRSKSKEVF